MDIFEDDNDIITGAPHDRGNTDFSPLYPMPQNQRMLVDQPSRVENFIGKVSGSLGRFIKFLFLMAGVVAVLAFFLPYLRFIFRFAEWLFRKVGTFF